jgi:hypothetical protein
VVVVVHGELIHTQAFKYQHQTLHQIQVVILECITVIYFQKQEELPEEEEEEEVGRVEVEDCF